MNKNRVKFMLQNISSEVEVGGGAALIGYELAVLCRKLLDAETISAYDLAWWGSWGCCRGHGWRRKYPYAKRMMRIFKSERCLVITDAAGRMYRKQYKKSDEFVALLAQIIRIEKRLAKIS